MSKLAMLLVMAMAAAIVATDFLFFRHNFRGRLIANVIIVIVFGAAYCIFLQPS